MRAAFSLGPGFLFATLLTAPLAAQTSPTEKAAARALANEGDAALKKKDYATAFDKYDKAARLVPEALTLTLGIARAQLGLGKLVEAREAYNVVVRTALDLSLGRSDAGRNWQID